MLRGFLLVKSLFWGGDFDKKTTYSGELELRGTLGHNTSQFVAEIELQKGKDSLGKCSCSFWGSLVPRIHQRDEWSRLLPHRQGNLNT